MQQVATTATGQIPGYPGSGPQAGSGHQGGGISETVLHQVSGDIHKYHVVYIHKINVS